ncbi:MAG: zinc ribbon domain-containing protein [Fibrobacter sp.]|nr:zinc ribbon domain-containing protein [Fibrobacter sp.]
MFCSKCGNELQDEQAFCPNCGTAIQNTSKKQQKNKDSTSSVMKSIKKANPFEEELEYEKDKTCYNWKNLGWIILIIGAIIGYLLSNSDSPSQTTKTQSISPEQHCKDAQGRPRDWACRTALRSKGFNVDKYVKWGGADNGKDAAICTATDANGNLYAFEVVFDNKCNGSKVKDADMYFNNTGNTEPKRSVLKKILSNSYSNN